MDASSFERRHAKYDLAVGKFSRDFNVVLISSLGARPVMSTALMDKLAEQSSIGGLKFLDDYLINLPSAEVIMARNTLAWETSQLAEIVDPSLVEETVLECFRKMPYRNYSAEAMCDTFYRAREAVAGKELVRAQQEWERSSNMLIGVGPASNGHLDYDSWLKNAPISGWLISAELIAGLHRDVGSSKAA